MIPLRFEKIISPQLETRYYFRKKPFPPIFVTGCYGAYGYCKEMLVYYQALIAPRCATVRVPTWWQGNAHFRFN